MKNFEKKMRCKLIHWWIKNKQNCIVQLCTGILNWFQIRSELQTLYREEIRQVTKTNSNHFFCCLFFLFWGVDFVIFDLFSSLGHSYFLMILRIQHISFVFNSFFGEISKALEIDSREHRQGITFWGNFVWEAAPSYGGF